MSKSLESVYESKADFTFGWLGFLEGLALLQTELIGVELVLFVFISFFMSVFSGLLFLSSKGMVEFIKEFNSTIFCFTVLLIVDNI